MAFDAEKQWEHITRLNIQFRRSENIDRTTTIVCVVRQRQSPNLGEWNWSNLIERTKYIVWMFSDLIHAFLVSISENDAINNSMAFREEKIGNHKMIVSRNNIMIHRLLTESRGFHFSLKKTVCCSEPKFPIKAKIKAKRRDVHRKSNFDSNNCSNGIFSNKLLTNWLFIPIKPHAPDSEQQNCRILSAWESNKISFFIAIISPYLSQCIQHGRATVWTPVNYCQTRVFTWLSSFCCVSTRKQQFSSTQPANDDSHQ